MAGPAGNGAEIGRVSVRVVPDWSGFRSKVARELQAVEASLRDLKVKITAEIDENGSLKSFNDSIGDLNKRVEKTITVDADVNKKSLDRVVGMVKDVLGGVGKGLNTIGIGDLLGGGGDITVLVKTIGALALVGPALALSSAALAGLPGILAGVMAPLSVATLMMMDFEKTFENATGRLLEFKGPLVDLQNALKGGFELGFSGQDTFNKSMPQIDGFQKLKDIIVELKPFLADLAKSMGGALSSFMDSFKGDTLDNVKLTIGNIAKGFRDAQPGIQQIVEAFSKLASLVTGSGMVSTFNEFARDFNNWLSEPGKMDQITKSLEGLLKIGRELADIALNAFTDNVAKLGEEGYADKIASLVKGLGAALGAVAALGNALIWLGDAPGKMMDSLKAIGNFFSTEWNNLVADFKKTFAPIGEFFGKIGDFLTRPLDGGGGMSMSILGVADGFTKLKEGAIEAWNIITNGVSGAISALTNFGSTVATHVSAAFDGLVTIASNAWNGLVSAVQTGVGTVTGVVSSLPGQIVSALGDLGSLLIESGASLMRGFASGIRKGIDWAVGAARDAMSAVRNLFPFSPAKEGPFSGTGYTTYSGQALIEGLAEGILNAKGSAVASMTDVMKELANVVDSSITDMQRSMQEAGSELGNGLLGLPFETLNAVAKSAMSDIGVSGNGALSVIADTGLDWAKDSITNIWQVNNMDDAILGERAQQNKRIAGIAGR